MLNIDLLNAAISAIIISIILGIIFIPFLRVFKFGQQVRDDGPKSHIKKSGTPTMGGIIILVCLIIVGAFFGIKYNEIFPILIFTVVCGMIGFIDDYIKIGLKRSLGLTARQKMLLQILASTVFVVYLDNFKSIGSKILVPFANGFSWDLNIFYIPFAIFVIVATINSVNLTDGLDGLASGITAIVSLFFAVASLYFNNTSLSIFSFILMGSCLGFLFFNLWPAKVFMGDTGSLALGGAVAGIAIMLKLPLVLIIVGGIYVIEALSDIIQVTSYKLTGKRVFKMAPLHHHFELKGWNETKVVFVFWIISAVLNVIGLVSLI